MKNLKKIECIALTPMESQQITGGSENVKTNFWLNIAWIGGTIAQSVVVFGTEGGRNAGLSVR